VTTVEALLKAVQLTAGLVKFAKDLKGLRLAKSITIDTSRTEACLRDHVNSVQQWAATVQVEPVAAPRHLSDIYVDLNLKVSRPAKRSGKSAALAVDGLADVEQSIVLLGQPGAGKTTAVKRLLSMVCSQRTQRPRLPILVTLRSLGANESLLDHLCGIAGIRIDLSGDGVRALRRKTQLQSLGALFEKIRASVFLDGLDEVPTSSFSAVVDEVNQLLEHASRTRFCITCRKSAYVHNIPNAMTLELQTLTGQQVREIAKRWLSAERTTEFVSRLAKTPYAGTELRPLVLAVLLLLFIRFGDVPVRPKTVYEKILRLFLEDWDTAKNVKRESKYADFPVDRKEEFLEALAFVLTTNGLRGQFSHDDLLDAYEAIHRQFGLPRAQATAVAREIESHTGLVTQVSEDEYSFFHLTIHEYLTARFIVRSGIVCPPGIRVSEHPNEYAVAVGYSSSPSVFCREVIQRFVLERGADRMVDAAGRFAPEFAGRLVTESPNWKVDEPLGAAMCVLVSKSASSREDEAYREVSESVMAMDGVRDSVILFAKKFTRSVEEEGKPTEYEVNYKKVDERGSADLLMFLEAVGKPARLRAP
jgi:hypothetical protein